MSRLADPLRIIPTIGMTPFRKRIIEAGNERTRERMAERREDAIRRKRDAQAEIDATLARLAAERQILDAVVDEGKKPRNWHPATLIIREVAEKHGLTVADLKGRSRKVPIVLARQEAAYRIVTEAKASLPEAGRRLGGRDHTTILQGVRRHRSRLAEARP